MKKLYFSLFVIVATITFLTTCSKHEPDVIDDKITIIYENMPSDPISTSILDNHLVNIERIGQFNGLAKQIYESPNWNILKDKKLKLNLNDIHKYTYDYSDATMFSIPFSDCDDKTLILYEYENIYVPAVAHIKKFSNNYCQFYLRDLDGSIYYQLMLSPEHKIGKFSLFNDLPFKEYFGKSSKKSLNLPADQTCPQSTSSFGECMLCGIDECADDWICAVVCMVASRECLAGFAIGCIFFTQ